MAEEAQFQFDYDKLASILDGRQKATEESVLKGYFKEQGLTGEEMAQAVQAFKDQRAAQQPDISGMQKRLEDMQRAMEDANRRSLMTRIESAVTVEAAKLGVSPKAIPYLVRMGDFTQVADAEGNVDPAKVADGISKVLDDLPELKPQAREQKGFRVGGEGGKNEQPADAEQIRRIFKV